jgi:F-type H+-transporting ATPase subunit c
LAISGWTLVKKYGLSTLFSRRKMMAIEGVDLIKAAAFLGAGLSMGLGAIGPGVGEGMAAAKACEAIGRNPKEAGLLTRTMLVGQAVSESTGIYSLVVALLLLFVV